MCVINNHALKLSRDQALCLHTQYPTQFSEQGPGEALELQRTSFGEFCLPHGLVILSKLFGLPIAKVGPMMTASAPKACCGDAHGGWSMSCERTVASLISSISRMGKRRFGKGSVDDF